LQKIKEDTKISQAMITTLRGASHEQADASMLEKNSSKVTRF
jgi:hypothetical protein